jgi:hypothetical protein
MCSHSKAAVKASIWKALTSADGTESYFFSCVTSQSTSQRWPGLAFTYWCKTTRKSCANLCGNFPEGALPTCAKLRSFQRKTMNAERALTPHWLVPIQFLLMGKFKVKGWRVTNIQDFQNLQNFACQTITLTPTKPHLER